jgi:hypothetical protein
MKARSENTVQLWSYVSTVWLNFQEEVEAAGQTEGVVEEQILVEEEEYCRLEAAVGDCRQTVEAEH